MHKIISAVNGELSCTEEGLSSSLQPENSEKLVAPRELAKHANSTASLHLPVQHHYNNVRSLYTQSKVPVISAGDL